MKGSLPDDVAAQAKNARCQPDQDWRRDAGRRRGGPPPRTPPDPDALQSFLDTERRLQHHGQHDAGGPRHGAHSRPRSTPGRATAPTTTAPWPLGRRCRSRSPTSTRCWPKNHLQELTVAPTKLTDASRAALSRARTKQRTREISPCFESRRGDIFCELQPVFDAGQCDGSADLSGNIDEELRHVRKVIDERPLFLSFGGKASYPLLLPLGHVKIAVGADGEA